MISRFQLLILICLGCMVPSNLMAQVKVDALEISGNKRTRNWVIEREWHYTAPDSIIDTTESKYLLTFDDRLSNTNLFNKVVTRLVQRSDSVILQVDLVEKWYSWPIPFMEFSDRNFNIWQDLDFGLERTNYGLYLFNYNIWGLNHTAKFSMVYGYNRKYGLEYRIPFLGPNSHTGLALRIQHNDQDELWHYTESDKLGFLGGRSRSLYRHDWAALQATHRLEPQLQMDLSWASSRMQVDEAARYNQEGQPFLEKGKYMQIHHFVGLQFSRENRNNRYFATEGNYTALALESEFGDLNNFRLRFEHSTFPALRAETALAFGLHLEHNSNGERAYRNTRMFGYERYVRGYESFVVDGQSSVLVRSGLRRHLLDHEYPLKHVPFVSYRFLPIQAFAELFADAGYVQSSQVVAGNALPNQWLWSVGLGLNALAYNDKVFRFEYSLNGLSQWGWYVHFASSI